MFIIEDIWGWNNIYNILTTFISIFVYFAIDTSLIGASIIYYNCNNLRSAFRISVFVIWGDLLRDGTIKVNNTKAIPRFCSSRGGEMMVILLPLFFYLNIISWLWCRLRTSVKILLFTLIALCRLTSNEGFVNFIQLFLEQFVQRSLVFAK